MGDPESIQFPTQPYRPEFTGGLTVQGVIDEPHVAAEPDAAHPAQPTVVPGVPQFLGRWTFVAVTAGVWILAAAAGLGLYYWWYHSLDKTGPVFVVLVYLVACVVGGLLTALVPNKPVAAAVAIALTSAPLASTAAAAALYGGYAYGWITS